jgi:hypothetical protein
VASIPTAIYVTGVPNNGEQEQDRAADFARPWHRDIPVFCAMAYSQGVAAYRALYVFDHDGLIPGYQTHAAYLEDIDTVLVQLTNLTDFSGYQWNLAQIGHGRIAKFLRREAGGH